MTSRYFVDHAGRFIGAFGDGALPDLAGVAEVPVPPADARQVWSGSAWTWPLDIAKADLLQQLQARYLAALDIGMMYAGRRLQIREADQQNIATMGQEARWALASVAPWPSNFAWRMADNSFLSLPDAAAMIALGEAAKAEVYRLRQVKWGHADAIAAAGSTAALALCNIDEGW